MEARHANHDDIDFAYSGSARFRRRLPAALIEIVDDANHIITVDQPEVVEKLLADFLY